MLGQKGAELPPPSLSLCSHIQQRVTNLPRQAGKPLRSPPQGCWHRLQPRTASTALTWAITSWDQMSEARVRCPLLSPSEGLSSVGPKTVARLWRDILLIGSFSATLRGTGRERG